MAAVTPAGVDRVRRLTVRDVDLEVREAGSGPPLLVLHGLLELPNWYPYLETLATYYRVIAPTHPGFGSSTRPNWLETVDDLAYFYLDLIASLGSAKVDLLGFSFGGWIAAEMAVRCDHQIGRLVLGDALGLKIPNSPIADWLVLDPGEIRPLAWHDSATGDVLKLPAEATTTEAELTTILANRETATLYGWKPFFHNPRLGNHLGRISIPTLVVWGEHDRVVPPAIGEAYAAGIPNARRATVAGAAHLPQLERPAEFTRLVTEFLAGEEKQ